MGLLDIINGIDRELINETEETYTVGYERDGEEMSRNVKASSTSEARNKFKELMDADGKDSGDYRIKGVYKSASMDEENVTSNLDGGLGQPKTPHAFQNTKPSQRDKQKEYETATKSTGYIVAPKTNNYIKKKNEMFDKMSSLIERVDDLNEFGEESPEAVNNDAWVIYTTANDERLSKTKIADKGSRLAAVRLFNQLVRSEDFGTKSSGAGMMKKDEWDEREAPYAKHEIKEVKYNEYASDGTMSQKKKINTSILEVNRKLYEIERMVNHASRLKSESGIGDVFWQSTKNRFAKISERMLRIGTKLREFNS